MQDRVANTGRGVVVMDIKASKEEIFETLTQFERYAEIIPTVREVSVYRKSSEMRTAVSLHSTITSLLLNAVLRRSSSCPNSVWW